ncbi:MAG: ATP-binding protein [Gammaproteobacteria bacterium]|nr:ATP-binding protein [Gammaproteobacteria bacterium]
MMIFNGLAKINEKPPAQQQAFELFAHETIQNKFKPLFADWSLIVAIVSAILFIVSHLLNDSHSTPVHPLTYVYVVLLGGLLVAHRKTELRTKSPLVVYLIFSIISSFGFLDYFAKQGDIKALYGLFFFLSSVGFLTFSIKHSLIMVGITLGMLVLVSSGLPAQTLQNHSTVTQVLSVLSNWLIVSCIVLAPAWALLNQWLFRNILALQFIADKTNQDLSTALRTLKETEKKLIQQQKNQALNHMAAGLLHEIINPVNSSIQAINYAQSVNQQEELNEVLEDALQQQKRVVTTVEELKVFSKPNPDYEKSIENFSDLLNTASNLCKHELTNITIVNNLKPDLSLKCYPTACIQVLINLLTNAASAIKQKSHQPKSHHEKDRQEKPQQEKAVIEINGEANSDTITIAVKDNGIGIKPEELDKISDPFYSSQDTEDRMGLGLSICQTIMRHHSGKLSIESEMGKWTQVSLVFPN